MKKFVWLNDKIIPEENAFISINCPAFHYGINAFENIRCYYNEKENQLYAFRLESHLQRLYNSAKLARLNPPISISDLRNAFLRIIQENSFKEDLVVRVSFFLESGSWGNEGPVGVLINPMPRGRAFTNKNELHCMVSSWQRINDNSMPPRIKIGANYMNSRLAIMEAKINGYDTAILLNEKGKVSETPSAAIFIVLNGVLITPPYTASVLESITQDTVIKIAQYLRNIKVNIQDIDRTQLYLAEEIFICGTTIEIMPVASVDKIFVKNQRFLITKDIRNTYFEIVRGQKKEFKEWLTPIY